MLSTPSPVQPSRSKGVRILILWLPPVGWAVMIFIVSSLPGGTIPSPFFSADKVFHLGMFAVLGYLVAKALDYHGKTRRTRMLLALFLCLLYGASDEIHQAFVPDRTPSVMDVAADIAGSCIGIMVRVLKG